MKTQWNAHSRLAGAVSLRLMILAAAICGALYFFSRPKPAPPVAAATPTPAPATPVPAPATPPSPAIVETVPEPPLEPPQIAAVALPPPLDLATVARTPALWPKQVALLQPTLFPVVVNGRHAGNATLPAGTPLRLLRIVGAQVEVEYQNARQLLPAGSTDLMARALAAAKAAAPAPASPLSDLASAGAPPPGAVEAAPPPPPAASPQADTAPAGKIPGLRVQAMVGTSSRRTGSSSYVKEMTIKPKAIIEGTSRMTPIPRLDATMIVVTMGTMAKYVAGKEAYSVHTVETMPLGAAASGDARALTFAESRVTFDSWRDDSNIGGQVYKYFVFGLVDPATKTIVDFQTNNPGLAALCKKRPEKREEFLNLKARAKFPANF